MLVCVADELFDFARKEFGVYIDCNHVFASENNTHVQKHIRSNFPMLKKLFTDNAHLGSSEGSIVAGAVVAVPHCDVFAAAG